MLNLGVYTYITITLIYMLIAEIIDMVHPAKMDF